MKSVRTMALSLVAAGAAAGGSLFAQVSYPSTGLSALPESRYPISRTAYEPTTVVPADDGGPITDESDPSMKYPAPYGGAAPAPVHAHGEGCADGKCGGDYAHAMESPWTGDCGCEVPSACGPRWFASAAGLVMTRDNPNRSWVSYEDGNPPNQLMSTQDADGDWGGGFETRIGACCGCNTAFEAIYWGVWGIGGESSVTHPNGVATPIDVGGVDIAGFPAQNYFDGASIHRVTREDEFHNVELNWIYNYAGCSSSCCTPCGANAGSLHGSPFNVSFLAGFRYFRFEEALEFASAQGGETLDNPDASAYLDIDVENNLYGFQVGARADYCCGGLSLFAAPKVGVFGNDVSGRSYLHNGNDELGFDIENSENDVAMLAQLDLGADYHITECFKIYGGYRVVAVTGVALSDEQIPPFLVDAPAFEDLDTNGSLILHGAFVGAEYRF